MIATIFVLGDNQPAVAKSAVGFGDPELHGALPPSGFFCAHRFGVPPYGRFRAYFKSGDKQVCVGTFDTLAEAVEARERAIELSRSGRKE